MRMNPLMLLWLVSVTYITGTDTRGSTNYGVRDFCEGEVFEARCSSDEVIVMQSAVYGRMHLGRCVKVDMGYIGCKENVLDLADGRCSGRQQCEISIPDTLFEKKQPCLELKSYLQASYSCLKVIPVDTAQCRRSKVMRVTQTLGYIASSLSQSTWCGVGDTPWLIEALPGQRINLTLMDFSSGSPGDGYGYGESFNGVEVCQKYAVIREEIPERSTVLCGGRAREHNVYLSNSNAVRISIEPNKQHFVIKFEVQGCPDPETAPNTWFRRENNDITIGCKDSDDSWKLTCSGTKWHGELGNCSRTEYARTSHMTTGGILPRRIVVVTVCGIAFVVGILILMIGIFFFRKYKQRPDDVEGSAQQTPAKHATTPAKTPAKAPPKNMKPLEPMPGTIHEEVTVYIRPSGGKAEICKERHRKCEENHPSSGSPMYQKGIAKNEYTHIWEMPLPTPEDS